MANIDFSNRSFDYYPSNAIIVAKCIDGKWTEPQVTKDFNLSVHCFAGVFHYAPSCFEGLKAYRGVDGRVRLFRADESAKRMQSAGWYLDMPAPSEELFISMCEQCIRENWEFIPPYGSSASFYLRPILFGSNPILGVKPSDDVTFVVMSSSVGTYSGDKLLHPTNAVISRNYDRAATYGSGKYKLGGNYAQSLHAYSLAHKSGYKDVVFLDSGTHTHIDEFGASNFFAIKDDRYITPKSDSILPSITNKSIRVIAADMGLKVEQRVVPVEELAEFDEVYSCGTGLIVTPMHTIDDKVSLESKEVTKRYTFGSPDECGHVGMEIYKRMYEIQRGLAEDKYGWCKFVEEK